MHNEVTKLGYRKYNFNKCWNASFTIQCRSRRTKTHNFFLRKLIYSSWHGKYRKKLEELCIWSVIRSYLTSFSLARTYTPTESYSGYLKNGPNQPSSCLISLIKDFRWMRIKCIIHVLYSISSNIFSLCMHPSSSQLSWD